MTLLIFLAGITIGFFLGFCVGDAHGFLDALNSKECAAR